MSKIAILGAGTMGSSMAKCYSSFGNEVSLFSRTKETLNKAKSIINNNNVSYTTSIDEAVKDAWYVVETVSEKRDVKESLYAYLDRILPGNVIISSNTSYMNIFEFMPNSRLTNTCIVHWFAPADILPLVEITKGPLTSEEAIKKMVSFHKECGKTPVRLEKYIPGFIINRLQSAMNREVLELLSNGYCTAEDIDLAVKTSLMPRGMLLGVVQRMDFNGIDNINNGLKNKSFVPAKSPDENNIVNELVSSGNLGIKTGKGFYDYREMSYLDAIAIRDEQLKKSVELAKSFIDNPIGKPKK